MESIGRHLQSERRLRQMSLEEISQITRIPLRMLRHLEADDFDALPGDVFIRGFIASYARVLGLDAPSLVATFRECRAEGQEEEESTPSIVSVASPERGRRFGIAVALVILLVLFTLALSIVVRPRHRNAPIELSLRTECLVEPTSLERCSSAPSTIATPTASSRS